MKRLFLTSSVSFVASDIAKHLEGVKGLKLAFINTPSEVEEGDLQWLEDDREALVRAGFTVSDYTITGKSKEKIKVYLKSMDVIYISGGNTFYLLEKIQQSNCAAVIRDYVENGKIYIGTSSGSIVAGPDIYPTYRLDNVKKAPNLKGYQGLGLVDFVVLPHWGSDDFRKLYLEHRLEHAYTTGNKIILLTDYQYVYVEGERYRIIEVAR